MDLVGWIDERSPTDFTDDTDLSLRLLWSGLSEKERSVKSVESVGE